MKEIIDELADPLFGFCFALTGKTEEAEQLIVDAYTVFLLREKKFLRKEKVGRKGSRERRAIKKYLYKELLGEILDLAQKRPVENKNDISISGEYESFFQMSLLNRAVLYLKEVKGFHLDDIQQVLNLERHRAVELYYNARYEMVRDMGCLYRQENMSGTYR